MTNIKNKIITFISIYKIINKIKKSKDSALKIGTELSHFGYYLYINILNDDTDFSNELDNKNIYEIFKHNAEFEHYIIMKYLNKNIEYKEFFKILSNKLYNIKKEYISSFLRGYYLNILDLYSTNINYYYIDYNYFVLYDYHPYLLLLIYKIIIKEHILSYKIKLLFNYIEDKYAINENTEDCNYKLIFTHKTKYYNNNIKNILELLFYNITDKYELLSNNEKDLYNIYLSYLIVYK
jgi:hypothetical protein